MNCSTLVIVQSFYVWSYSHDGRADKDSYPHYGCADNAPF